MYERLDKSTSTCLAYRISAKLDRQEMRQITDELEGAIAAAGKIKVLLDLQAFPYRDLGAFWEDLKFDVKYGKSIERLAIVGGGKLEEWAIRIFAVLTSTACRRFDEGRVDEAWEWLTRGTEGK